MAGQVGHGRHRNMIQIIIMVVPLRPTVRKTLLVPRRRHRRDENITIITTPAAAVDI